MQLVWLFHLPSNEESKRICDIASERNFEPCIYMVRSPYTLFLWLVPTEMSIGIFSKPPPREATTNLWKVYVHIKYESRG